MIACDDGIQALNRPSYCGKQSNKMFFCCFASSFALRNNAALLQGHNPKLLNIDTSLKGAVNLNDMLKFSISPSSSSSSWATKFLLFLPKSFPPSHCDGPTFICL